MNNINTNNSDNSFLNGAIQTLESAQTSKQASGEQENRVTAEAVSSAFRKIEHVLRRESITPQQASQIGNLIKGISKDIGKTGTRGEKNEFHDAMDTVENLIHSLIKRKREDSDTEEPAVKAVKTA